MWEHSEANDDDGHPHGQPRGDMDRQATDSTFVLAGASCRRHGAHFVPRRKGQMTLLTLLLVQHDEVMKRLPNLEDLR